MYAVTFHSGSQSDGALIEIDGLGLVRNGEAHIFSDAEVDAFEAKHLVSLPEAFPNAEFEHFEGDEAEADPQIERPDPVMPPSPLDKVEEPEVVEEVKEDD